MDTLEKINQSIYDYRGRMSKGEIIGNLLEDCFNGLLSSKDKAEFCQYITQRSHRYLQSEMFKFCLAYIKTYAKLPDVCFDGRNQWVQNTAKAMCDTAAQYVGGKEYKVFEHEQPIGIINE